MADAEMKLTIRDKGVDGDFQAEIRTSEKTSFGKYVTLKYGDRCCGAIAKFVTSEDESVCVDKYLRLFLDAKNDDWVEIEDSHPDAARSISIAPLDHVTIDDQEVASIRSLLQGKPVCQEMVFPRYYHITGDKREFMVTATQPAGVVIVNNTTKISIKSKIIDEPPKHRTGPTWADIGGLDREIADIRRRIEYPIRNASAFGHFGADMPRGILLTGPPGTGKTLIARALANEAGAHIEIIQGPQIVTPFMGQSEQTLFETFDKARAKAPSIILIDEIDSLASRREQQHSEASSRIATALLVLMDGLKPMDGVVVIGTTNRPEELDDAVRRPGRFDYEIMIGIPDKTGRRDIIEIHTTKQRHMPLAADVDKDRLAEITHGFTGADLASLCREAGYCSIFRYYRDTELQSGQISPDPSMVVTQQDFLQAIRNVQPTAMRSGIVEDVRDVNLEEVGGLDEVKELLVDNMNSLINQSQVFEKVGFKPATGTLLYGPSGTGKTMLARAVANACGVHLITLRGPEIHRKWFGESEELVRKVFAKAR